MRENWVFCPLRKGPKERERKGLRYSQSKDTLRKGQALAPRCADSKKLIVLN